MLSATRQVVVPAKTPSLAPLVVGSPVAVAIHDIWTGRHSVTVHIDDYVERAEAAATVSAHLAARARIKVRVRTPQIMQLAIVRELLAQIPLDMVAVRDRRIHWPYDASSWPDRYLDGTAGVMVDVWDGSTTGAFAQATVVTEPTLADVGPRKIGGRVIHITDRPVALLATEFEPLEADIPLDVAIAGQAN